MCTNGIHNEPLDYMIITTNFKMTSIFMKYINSADEGLPDSLGDWESEIRNQERTGSPSTLLPLLSSLITSSHCSSRLLSPLLQTLLTTLDQPNPSTSGLNSFPMMPQSEVLLDLLDMTGEDSKLDKWGPSVTALVMRLRAAALASMILQVAIATNTNIHLFLCKGRLDLVLWRAIRVRQPCGREHRGVILSEQHFHFFVSDKNV